MKRFALSTLSLCLALQPMLASAAFDTPQDLSKALQSAAAPKSMTGTVHIETTEGTFVTIWMSGIQTGKGTLQDGTVDMKMTVDLSMPTSNMTARAKIALRDINGAVYVQLLSLDGLRDDPFSMFKLNGMMKKWVKVDTGMTELFFPEQAVEESTSMANDMFDMMRSDTAKGSSYSLTLKPGFLDSSSLVPGLAGSDNQVTMHIVVNTDKNDVYQNGRMYMTSVNTAGKFVMDVQTTAVPAPAALVAPEDAVDLNALFGSFDFLTSPYPSFTDPNEGMPLPPDTQWIGQPSSSESSSWSDDSGSDLMPFDNSVDFGSESAPEENHDRPSRRQIMEKYKMQEQKRTDQLSNMSSGSTSSYAPVGDYLPALPADGYTLGNANAPVTVVEFVDYGCAFCATFNHDTMPTIISRYIKPGTVRWVYRNLPISYHPAANVAAMAVECSRDQSEKNAGILSQYYLMTTYQNKELTQDDVYAGIQALDGIDTEKMYLCIDSAMKQPMLDQDSKDADNGGVNGVPSFWVLGKNGKAELIQGGLEFAAFKKVLDNMLK